MCLRTNLIVRHLVLVVVVVVVMQGHLVIMVFQVQTFLAHCC